MAYKSDLQPMACPLESSVKYAGAEDLQVYANNTGYLDNIHFQAAAYCWVKNIESNYADGDHVRLLFSYRCEVRDSYFHDGFMHYGGQTDDCIFLGYKTSACRVENNILRRLHVSVMLNWGAAGNVIAYNYGEGNFKEKFYNCLATSLSIHGAHPMFNLWEGNVVSKLYIDSLWGSTSHNTAFRNWFLGTSFITQPLTGRGSEQTDTGWWAVQANRAVDIEFQVRYTNLVSNVIGSPQMLALTYYNHGTTINPAAPMIIAPTTRPYDSRSYGYSFGYVSLGDGDISIDPRGNNLPYTTAFIHGDYNWVDGSIIWDTSTSSHTLPASLYLAEKPVWFGDVSWPAIGSDVDGYVSKIPAQLRWEEMSAGDVDKTALNTAISAAEALNAEDYTAESWSTLQTALTAARAVSADENATQSDVDTALANLQAAINGLVNISAGGETYYVDNTHPQASNQNSGTETLPWTHCPGMVGWDGTVVLKPGDTVYFNNAGTWETATGTDFLQVAGGVTYDGRTWGSGIGTRAVLQSTARISTLINLTQDHPDQPTVIRGFLLDSNGFATTGVGINPTPASLIGAVKRIEDIVVQHVGNNGSTIEQFGIGINSLSGRIARNVEILDCEINDINSAGICVDANLTSTENLVENLVIRGCDINYTGLYQFGGIRFRNHVKNVTVEENIIRNNVSGPGIRVYVSNSNLRGPENLVIQNNEIRDAKQYGIELYLFGDNEIDILENRIIGSRSAGICLFRATDGDLSIRVNDNMVSGSFVDTFGAHEVRINNVQSNVSTFELNNNILASTSASAYPLYVAGNVITSHTGNVYYRTAGGNLVNAVGVNYTAGNIEVWEPGAQTQLPSIDKTALNVAISAVEALNAGNYTAESWSVLQTAFTAAQAVADDENATQSDVDTAQVNLQAAINGLVGDGEATITVTGPGTVEKGKTFTVGVIINTAGKRILAADIGIGYDPDLFEYVGYTDEDGGLNVAGRDTNDPGELRFVLAGAGEAGAVTGESQLFELTFKAKSITGFGGIVATSATKLAKLVTVDGQTEVEIIQPDLTGTTVEIVNAGDMDNDGDVDVADIAFAALHYYKTDSSPDWDTVKIADINIDSIIDFYDLVYVAMKMLE